MSRGLLTKLMRSDNTRPLIETLSQGSWEDKFDNVKTERLVGYNLDVVVCGYCMHQDKILNLSNQNQGGGVRRTLVTDCPPLFYLERNRVLCHTTCMILFLLLAR